MCLQKYINILGDVGVEIELESISKLTGMRFHDMGFSESLEYLVLLDLKMNKRWGTLVA